MFRPYAQTLAVAVVLIGLSVAQSVGQVVEYRDFDTEQLDQASAGQDGVKRSQAVELTVDRTNEFRKQHDRSPVQKSGKLTATAQGFADYMARTDRYGHHADGRTPAERISAHEYDYCLVAENIAMRYNSAGYETEQLANGLVQGWIDSPEHRKNMLDPDVTEIGAGLAMSDKSGRYYAVQLFGRPKSQSIEFEIANRSQTDAEYELADQTFSLPPRMTRIHTRCRPAELVVKLPQQEPRKIKVKSGSRYLIERGDDGELQVATQSGAE